MNQDILDYQAELYSKNITKAYSTSFWLATKLIYKNKRQDIYNIYGLVRVVDELVDTLKPQNSIKILDALEKETYSAIRGSASLNPAVVAFAKTAKIYDFDLTLVKAFFSSMRMDVSKTRYSQTEYKNYIFGSAEVVGLMCLKVFCKDLKRYNDLSAGAKALGSAFQKVNFLRDFSDDYKTRKRIYFPGVSYVGFSDTQKQAIETNIVSDFVIAKNYIRLLPRDFRYASLLAYKYYFALLKRIQSCDTKKLKQVRTTLPNRLKLAYYVEVWLLRLIRW